MTSYIYAATALIGPLRHFIPSLQRRTLLELVRKGEEAQYFREKVAEILKVVETMPKTYGQDGKGEDAIVYLHYFGGSFDAWITERDAGDGTGDQAQHQAYGKSSSGGDPDYEYGYISLPEMFGSMRSVELDLHWTPKALKDIK